jgi:hypothetical protein
MAADSDGPFYEDELFDDSAGRGATETGDVFPGAITRPPSGAFAAYEQTSGVIPQVDPACRIDVAHPEAFQRDPERRIGELGDQQDRALLVPLKVADLSHYGGDRC